LDTLNYQKSELLENRGKISQQLKDNETAQQTQVTMRAELEKLQQRSQLFLSLNSLIGDAGGDAFNKIVQRITLKHLLSRANEQMKKLMDRYQLLMFDNKEKNEDQIWVSDLFMGNETRSINSVSGGERFVISLALALALSDMASQKVRIDSLFIDDAERVKIIGSIKNTLTDFSVFQKNKINKDALTSFFNFLDLSERFEINENNVQHLNHFYDLFSDEAIAKLPLEIYNLCMNEIDILDGLLSQYKNTSNDKN
jgi:hypothetical protein